MLVVVLGFLAQDGRAADSAKTLHVAFETAETGFDPQAIDDNYSFMVCDAIFDALYKKKTNGDGLEDVSGRGLQGMLVLLDAINRAGSTDPAKIQEALKATDLKQDQMAAGYRGVKFDAKGQNTLASSIVTQMRGGQYVAVWPKANATADIVLPYKGW